MFNATLNNFHWLVCIFPKQFLSLLTLHAPGTPDIEAGFVAFFQKTLFYYTEVCVVLENATEMANFFCSHALNKVSVRLMQSSVVCACTTLFIGLVLGGC
jgi:hypothetical protein